MILCSTLHPSQLQCGLRFTLFSPLHHIPFFLHGLLILKPTNRTLIFFIQCSVFLLESFSIFCIQYHFLNSMQYFSFENFLCIASNFSAMYNHNKRLVLAEKLLSYNNKNKICCILTKQCIYYLLHPSEKWRDAIKFCLFMFCFLPPRKCALHFFRSHSCYFCHLVFFHTSCNGFVFKTFARSRPWPFPYFQPSPSYLRELQDGRLFGRSVGESAQVTFLEKSRKEVLLSNLAVSFWEKRHFELNWATGAGAELWESLLESF